MNNRILKLAVTALFALPLCLAVAEDEKGKGKGRPGGKGGPGQGGFSPPKFGDIDSDGSGDVDQEEWTAFQVKMAKERASRSFKFIAGEDGKITEEDLKKMAQRRGAGKGSPGGGKGGPGAGKGAGKGKGEESAGGGTKPKRPALEE